MRSPPGREKGRLRPLIRIELARSRVERGRKEFKITKESRLDRRDRQTREFEANQKGLRKSIAESNRLVDEANVMIQRHRDERDSAEGK